MEAVSAAFGDAQGDEREEYWYEGIDRFLNFLVACYRGENGYLTLGPQSPVFYRFLKPSINQQIGQDLSGSPIRTRRRAQLSPGSGYYEMTVFFDADASDASGGDASIGSAREKTFIVPPATTNFRLVDFIVFLRKTASRNKKVVAVVEVKTYPWLGGLGDLVADSLTVTPAIENAMTGMLLQVIQQVQFAFSEHHDQDTIWALCVVGDWATAHVFTRARTPPLDPNNVWPEGYRPGKGQLASGSVPVVSQKECLILAGDGKDFSVSFKEQWDMIIKWASEATWA